jgi:uncharacterized protein YndB with AHSA1/START domain
MPVKKDPSGRRSVEAEVEVPGTPEEVWNAIATGPGITSWFVPSEVEERKGGQAVSHFSPDGTMDSVATITEWDPPRRLVMTTPELGPDQPPVATEWTVEAKSGGTCVVRVVHAWFGSSDQWDSQFEAHELGWAVFFRILRAYLTHFRGQPTATMQVMAMTPQPVRQAWQALAGPLGLAGAVEGQRVSSPAGAPRLAGVVERAGSEEYPELLLRLDEPAPGLAHLFAMPMGPQACLPLRLYLYGDRASATVARDEPVWQAWLNQLFPAPAGQPMTPHAT